MKIKTILTLLASIMLVGCGEQSANSSAVNYNTTSGILSAFREKGNNNSGSTLGFSQEWTNSSGDMTGKFLYTFGYNTNMKIFYVEELTYYTSGDTKYTVGSTIKFDWGKFKNCSIQGFVEKDQGKKWYSVNYYWSNVVFGPCPSITSYQYVFNDCYHLDTESEKKILANFNSIQALITFANNKCKSISQDLSLW